VHVTVVVPIVKDAPLTGAQLVVRGGCPPVTVGAGNDTTCADPSSDSTGLGAAGHEIWGAVDVGPVFDPPHAANGSTAHAPNATKRERRSGVIGTL
jgi:hypothetical protein